MILSGDAGATKTELALYEKKQKELKLITSEKFQSIEFNSPEEIIKEFLKGRNEVIDSACIGIPGPVDNGKVKSTNLPWELDEKELSGKLNIPLFKLTNDLECLATAVNFLSEDDLIMISSDKPKASDMQNKVIIAPSTGLGQAALIFTGSGYKVVATEGGHADFAPSDEIETDLLKYLRKSSVM
ncbi:MAG: ROK family protein [Ignavibacteria bacterium]|nr:ROK family protein [Ignavibacteria bacterium]